MSPCLIGREAYRSKQEAPVSLGLAPVCGMTAALPRSSAHRRAAHRLLAPPALNRLLPLAVA
eukprot:10335114-Alexandrium_andersonii.AAC.1